MNTCCFIDSTVFSKVTFKSIDKLFLGILANVFAILEHVNYSHIQLMFDNKYDVAYGLKK